MCLFWRIDPGCGWFFGWLWWFFDEALGVGVEGLIKGCLTGGVDGVGLSVVDLIGCHETDAGVMVVAVVPVEEGSAERLGVLYTAEALGELRLVFKGLEVAFREWVVPGLRRGRLLEV